MKKKYFRLNWKLMALTVILIVASVLRVGSSFGDLWLDEIWSLRWVEYMRYPWDVFRISHDNNHILNTLYMFLVGENRDWIWYRLLSILTGIGSVAILGYGTLRQGFLESITTCGLAAISYPLIQYSSEARGYAPALFFSLTSFYLIQGYWRQRTLRKLVMFWTSVVLGLFSHLTFIYVYLSIVLWSLVHEIGENRRNAFIELCKCHSMPILYLTLIYIFLKHLVLGGGPVYDPFEVTRRGILLALGLPEKGILGDLGVVFFFATFSYGIHILQKKQSDKWIFYLCVILLAPVSVFILKRPDYFYYRYFLVCFPFYYLLLSRVLVGCYRKSIGGKVFFIVVLTIFSFGNIQRTSDLLKLGRGHYRDAVLYMAERTIGSKILVGSDHDIRNEMLLSFYKRFLPAENDLVYLSRKSCSKLEPEWFITHSLKKEFEPPLNIKDERGRSYSLARSFRRSGTAGFHWFVYHNESGLYEQKRHN